MSEYKKTKVDDNLRARLRGIMRSSEGEIVREYIEAKLGTLAWKALDCDPVDLDDIQGRAHALEEMHRDLCRDRPNVDS